MDPSLHPIIPTQKFYYDWTLGALPFDPFNPSTVLPFYRSRSLALPFPVMKQQRQCVSVSLCDGQYRLLLQHRPPKTEIELEGAASPCALACALATHQVNLRIPRRRPAPRAAKRRLPTMHPVAAALFKPTAFVQKRACGSIHSLTLQQDAVC
jgi:hypothetical protein